ncbi:MAG: tRNA (adenosine(37)-N6)-dimethylallyltransferase MiaA, partial [Bacteroidetes bacterium]|nr:tRNA (adenosine(37)-N6)-dimethylallyltransferase MiaA [Bacteroidota bacterium]
MQIYRDLCVLTARPSSADLLLAPHRLYGILPGSHVCSAAEWVTRAVTEIGACWAAGSVPIVTGGTGLYVRALTQGLSPIPDIPDPVRVAARSLMDDVGPERFHQHLTQRDPQTAARLHPMDTQRNVRALEVFEATGRPLVEWQAVPPVPALQARFFVVIFDPPRP